MGNAIARMPSPLLPPAPDEAPRENISVAKQHYTGNVIRTADGDTIAVDTLARAVRIASIDAPESASKSGGWPSQPFSQAAKTRLNALLGPAPRAVELQCYEQDRYGRHVCDVFRGDTNIGLQMVESGHAWANTADRHRYLRNPSYLRAQAHAQRNQLGLWAQKEPPTPPWEWRKHWKP